MKHRVAAIICVLTFIFSIPCANAEWRQPEEDKIIVSGKIDGEKGNLPVTINVFRPGKGDKPERDDFVFHAQTLTDSNGKYEFTFSVSDGSGSYRADINENGEKKTEYIEFKKNNKTESGNSGGGGSRGGGGNRPKQSSNIAILPPAFENSKPEKLEKDIFDDLDNAKWAQEAIINLAEKGIVNGRTKTEFCPNENMKREEFAKIVSDAFLDEVTDEKDMKFEDVVKDSWYYSYVKKAYSAGVIKGKSDTLFGTGEFITREEMATILYRILKDSFTQEIVQHKFRDDGEISEYAREAVSVFYQNGIINGMGDNYFAPKSNATRAQVAKIVSDLLEFI